VHGEGDHRVDEVVAVAAGQAVAVEDRLELPCPGRGVGQGASLGDVVVVQRADLADHILGPGARVGLEPSM
jgi:hypothetical protein